MEKKETDMIKSLILLVLENSEAPALFNELEYLFKKYDLAKFKEGDN